MVVATATGRRKRPDGVFRAAAVRAAPSPILTAPRAHADTVANRPAGVRGKPGTGNVVPGRQSRDYRAFQFLSAIAVVI